MKKTTIALSCIIALLSFSFTACAMESPVLYEHENGLIHYCATVTGSSKCIGEKGSYTASLASMLALPAELFSCETVLEVEHRNYDDYEYKTQVDYYTFADDATLLLSSNGQVTYASPLGNALFQMYSTYGRQMESMESGAQETEGALDYARKTIDLIPSLPTLDAVRVSYTLTKEQAMQYASDYDKEYESYFDKTSSLAQTIELSQGNSTYQQLVFAYDDLPLGHYSYMIHSNERFIDMLDTVTIICDGKLVYLSLPTIYVPTQEMSRQPIVFTLEDAVTHFEEKLNEGLILEEVTVYEIAFEAGVTATGSGQDDFLIQPTWHFRMIPSAVISNTPPDYLDAAYASSTQHFVFNACTGEWISW